jgi:large conductance mechanosensitive channel
VDGFKKFLLRGNVVDLAVAVVIGAAFGAVVTGFVTSFITPLVGVATGAAGDVSRRSFELAGVQFPYGVFLQALISFVILAASCTSSSCGRCSGSWTGSSPSRSPPARPSSARSA